MRVALIHYWLVQMRGGEAVLDALLKLHPDADVFTNVYRARSVAELFDRRAEPKTTWINTLPFAADLYPFYVPWMPGALASLNLDAYDVVISSESGPSKWVIPELDARHICYAHTPMRYLWDQRHVYRDRTPRLARFMFDDVTERLRARDVASSARVDEFVANSNFVARRIRKFYRRDSTVIHPPVKIDDIGPPQSPEDFYLFVGKLVSYKGARTAVDACRALGRRLVVVGDGPDQAYVRRFADEGIEHLGRVSRAVLLDLMARCRALVFPGVEDFGMTPVETLAAGRPVVGYARGGILDTVEDGATGVLYDQPGPEGLAAALRRFEAWIADFQPSVAVKRAREFSPDVFARKWRALLGQTETAPHVEAGATGERSGSERPGFERPGPDWPRLSVVN